MKKDFAREITDLDGVVIAEMVNDSGVLTSTGRNVTIKKLCVDALLADTREELSGEAKVKRYRLAQKIHAAEGEIDITTEEASLVKELAAKMLPPLLYGQIYDFIEGV